MAPAPTTGTIDGFGPQRFNTTEKNDSTETFYECSETFSIVGGFHEGNVQDQTGGSSAITDIILSI